MEYVKDWEGKRQREPGWRGRGEDDWVLRGVPERGYKGCVGRTGRTGKATGSISKGFQDREAPE